METGVRHRIARLEIVGPVRDQIVVRNQRVGVFAGQAEFVSHEPHMRIESRDGVGGALYFRAANIGRAVQHLTLKVRKRDLVVVHHAQRAHASRRQILQHR